MSQGKIIKVSGPLVVADGLADANMADVVRVGSQRLIGEILNMTGDRASIQVYEETSGLGPGAAVVSTGAPLSVELGPGIIENIYDGIQRPLEEIVKQTGSNNLARGVEVSAISRTKKWAYTPVVKTGDKVVGGDVLGTVPETEVVLHKIMVPNGVSGTVSWTIGAGSYTVDEVIAKVRHLSETKTAFFRQAAQGGHFGFKAGKIVSDPQLCHARVHAGVITPGDDGDAQISPQGQLDADAVMGVKTFDRMPFSIHVQFAVGADAVHVKHKHAHCGRIFQHIAFQHRRGCKVCGTGFSRHGKCPIWPQVRAADLPAWPEANCWGHRTAPCPGRDASPKIRR